MAKTRITAAVTFGFMMIGAAAAVHAAPAPAPATTQAVDGQAVLANIRALLAPSGAAQLPMTFPNERLLDQPDSPSLTAAIDPKVMRPAAGGAGGAGGGAGPAVMVRSLATPRVIAPYRFAVPAAPMRGKKIRISGWLKAEGLQNWAGLFATVMGPDGRVDALDTMCDHAIYGSAPWKEYSSVVQVLEDSEAIQIGVGLTGKGTVWADGFQIALADDTEPCTDDRNWHAFIVGPKPGVIAHDEKVSRNGHPTTRFTVPPMVQRYGYFDSADRNIEPYLGKRIRMTAWLKCENVTGPSGLQMHVNGPGFRKIADDNMRGKRPLRGTTDWQKYETIADVPAQTQSIYSGLELIGAGTIWIDDVKLEVVGR